MLKLTLTALLIGAISAAAISSLSPPLCRVIATSEGISFPPLRVVTLTLRPGCPAGGHAFVHLVSTSGATDPMNRFIELMRLAPNVTYRGVLPNWHAEWKSESDVTYTIPETPVRTGGP
jgi:hypothetical protein